MDGSQRETVQRGQTDRVTVCQKKKKFHLRSECDVLFRTYKIQIEIRLIKFVCGVYFMSWVEQFIGFT